MLFRCYLKNPLKKVSSLHLAPSQTQYCFTTSLNVCCSSRGSPSTPLQGASGPCCASSCRGTWHIPVPQVGAWQPTSSTPSASPTHLFWSPLPRSSGPSSPRWVPGTFPGGCSWELWQFRHISQGLELQRGPLWAGVAHLCAQVPAGHSEDEWILVYGVIQTPPSWIHGLESQGSSSHQLMAAKGAHHAWALLLLFLCRSTEQHEDVV